MAKATKSAEAGENKKATKSAEAGETASHYEEWRVERTTTAIDDEKVKTSFEKLKLLRPIVKISEEEAATLNAGVASKNSHGLLVMYLLPDQDMSEFDITQKK